VDDQIAIVEVLEALLVEEGYQVLSCENGKEALALLATTRPHLMISDVQMPYVNGWQLLQILRAKPEWRSLPVILMSATMHLPFEPQDLDPATTYIAKPFSIVALLSMVNRLLHGS
jgi:CheY-like chemotaxis protein